MKKSFLSIVLLAACFCGWSQGGLPQFNQERLHISQTGFLVLSSWSVANLATGLVGQSATHGEARYFHRMNALWGGVNLLIALPAYINARRSRSDLPLNESVPAQASIEKIFIFNAGLDIAYLAGSAWLLEKANSSSNPDKYRGFGKSVLLQGGFLLIFDAIMFTTHNRHGKKLYKALNGLQLSPNSIGYNARF